MPPQGLMAHLQGGEQGNPAASQGPTWVRLYQFANYLKSVGGHYAKILLEIISVRIIILDWDSIPTLAKYF